MPLSKRGPGQDFLLVEHDHNDAAFIRACLRRAAVLNPLHWLRTGEAALDYLNQTGNYADRQAHPTPGLLLLSLKLPGISGFDVLARLRENPAFQNLRVVVLSSSPNSADLKRAYELGATSCLSKPLDFERFVEFSKALGGRWCWLNAPPEKPLRAGAPAGAPA